MLPQIHVQVRISDSGRQHSSQTSAGIFCLIILLISLHIIVKKHSIPDMHKIIANKNFTVSI